MWQKPKVLNADVGDCRSHKHCWICVSFSDVKKYCLMFMAVIGWRAGEVVCWFSLGVYFGRDFCIIVIVWESESSVYLCGSKFWHVHTPLI
jgi:hypothetical protein